MVIFLVLTCFIQSDLLVALTSVPRAKLALKTTDPTFALASWPFMHMLFDLGFLPGKFYASSLPGLNLLNSQFKHLFLQENCSWLLLSFG